MTSLFDEKELHSEVVLAVMVPAALSSWLQIEAVAIRGVW
jgi:hypothetical protein